MTPRTVRSQTNPGPRRESRRRTVGKGWVRLVCDAREAWRVLRMKLEAKANGGGGGGALPSQGKGSKGPKVMSAEL